jgi:hypothetical protein
MFTGFVAFGHFQKKFPRPDRSRLPRRIVHLLCPEGNNIFFFFPVRKKEDGLSFFISRFGILFLSRVGLASAALSRIRRLPQKSIKKYERSSLWLTG